MSANASTTINDFEADLGQYYACNANVSETSQAGSGNVTFYLSKVAIQPFAANATSANDGFGDGKNLHKNLQILIFEIALNYSEMRK